MESQTDKWVEDVLKSMDGATRAKPSPGMLTRIEEKVFQKAKRISSWQIAAAASIVFLINIFAVQHLHKPKTQEGTLVSAQSKDLSDSIISNYSIYE